MDRHFLIAVSEQKSALNGIRFVGDFFSKKDNIKATVFYATPKASMIPDSEKSLETMTQQKRTERNYLEKGKKATEDAAKVLFEKGFEKEHIIQKAQTQVFSKIADIIQEGEKGAYDAVVIGRRGISLLQEAFDESVSRALYEEDFTFPLWLCNSSDGSEKDILLYVDGSKASFQMADHVGFILSEGLTHKIDIIATEKILSDTEQMDEYTKALTRYGVLPERIRIKSPVSTDPAKYILKIIENENYAAVAMGKASSQGGLLTRLFKGPVCSVLFREMRRSALWLCP